MLSNRIRKNVWKKDVENELEKKKQVDGGGKGSSVPQTEVQMNREKMEVVSVS